MKFRILISFLLIYSFTFSQSTKEFDRKWELAKGHYSDKSYDMALMLFISLTSENSENPYVEYANYYTALTYFKLNKLRDSRQFLLQLQNKYPNWDKITDAKYLNSNIEFINENYTKALSLIESCESKDCINMKLHYLSKIQSLALLEKLKADFPNDKEIATIYCFKLANKTPLFQVDKDIIFSLISQFDIKNSKLKNILENSEESHFKDTFNIALIYPFQINQLAKFKNKRRNQFVIDHYWGMKEAIDTLSKSGIQIKLNIYDSKNDTNTVKELFSKDELKKMDLLVGPIYSSNMKYVSKFANENQIVCFNPLLSSSKAIKDSGFVYLYNPTTESIGRKAAEFVLDSFPGKKIMVLSYKENKDTLIANAFIERLAKDSIFITKKLFLSKGTDVLSQLSKIKNNDIDVIFSPSVNTSIGTNLISWQIMREINIPVIGNAKWLEAREYNINQANDYTTYFFDENYQLSNQDSTLRFKENYFKNYNLPPTEAAIKGYELGMFLGYNLTKYGKYFNQALWNMENQNGTYYPVFNYTNSYFNNFVPVLKLEDYQLVPVNFNDKKKQLEESTNERIKK